MSFLSCLQQAASFSGLGEDLGVTQFLNTEERASHREFDTKFSSSDSLLDDKVFLILSLSWRTLAARVGQPAISTGTKGERLWISSAAGIIGSHPHLLTTGVWSHFVPCHLSLHLLPVPRHLHYQNKYHKPRHKTLGIFNSLLIEQPRELKPWRVAS